MHPGLITGTLLKVLVLQNSMHVSCACRWGDGLEYDQNEPRQRLCNWLDKASGCTLFDFVTKGIISEAVRHCQYWRLRDSQGKQPGLLGWWPSRAVTFLDNHDTGAGPAANLQETEDFHTVSARLHVVVLYMNVRTAVHMSSKAHISLWAMVTTSREQPESCPAERA